MQENWSFVSELAIAVASIPLMNLAQPLAVGNITVPLLATLNTDKESNHRLTATLNNFSCSHPITDIPSVLPISPATFPATLYVTAIVFLFLF